MPTPATRYLANADYEERDSNALHLAPGDEVKTGTPDRAWPGWIWAVGPDGRAGYVPEDLLLPTGHGTSTATGIFDPTVLTIRRGDRLTSLRQIHGWHWCRNEAGHEGWIAGYLLQPDAHIQS